MKHWLSFKYCGLHYYLITVLIKLVNGQLCTNPGPLNYKGKRRVNVYFVVRFPKGERRVNVYFVVKFPKGERRVNVYFVVRFPKGERRVNSP